MTLALATLAGAPTAQAADTVETWDVGATDVDFFLGYSGVGRPQQERRLCGEIVLGYGIVERFSTYLGASVSASEIFTTSSSDVFLGIFGTPVDTAHFDMDLFLDMRAAGLDETDFTLTPALELNVDSDQEMHFIGAYLHLRFPIYGRSVDQFGGGEPETVVAGDVEATVGAYVTLAERHQILAAYDMLFRLGPDVGGPVVEVGGVALGYNVGVHDSIELVSEVRVDIPQDDEHSSVCFTLGFIATVPSTRTQEPDDAE